MHYLVPLAWITLSVPLTAGTQPEPPHELVRRLGSPKFADREDAEKQLLRLGPAALPAVRAGLKSPDAEVRARCRRVLPLLEAREWARRADAYAADLRGKMRHDLPLQELFEKVTGTGPPARRLFAECVRTNGPLLQRASDPGRGRAALRARCRELYTSLNSEGRPTAAGEGDLAALLLATLAVKDAAPGWDEPTAFAHLLGNPGVRAASEDRDTGEAFRRLLLAWAGSLEPADVVSRQCFLGFVSAAEFQAGLGQVARTARDPAASPVNLRALGVWVLGEVGGPNAARELEKLWDDRTVLLPALDGSGGKGCLGDQALAASLRAAGKDPADYGLASQPLRFRGPARRFFDAHVYWFPTEDDRRKALKAWREEAARRK